MVDSNAINFSKVCAPFIHLFLLPFVKSLFSGEFLLLFNYLSYSIFFFKIELFLPNCFVVVHSVRFILRNFTTKINFVICFSSWNNFMIVMNFICEMIIGSESSLGSPSCACWNNRILLNWLLIVIEMLANAQIRFWQLKVLRFYWFGVCLFLLSAVEHVIIRSKKIAWNLKGLIGHYTLRIFCWGWIVSRG